MSHKGNIAISLLSPTAMVIVLGVCFALTSLKSARKFFLFCFNISLRPTYAPLASFSVVTLFSALNQVSFVLVFSLPFPIVRIDFGIKSKFNSLKYG